MPGILSGNQAPGDREDAFGSSYTGAAVFLNDETHLKKGRAGWRRSHTLSMGGTREAKPGVRPEEHLNGRD
jgi:hypothetical protein